jgi:hypothetical protein
MLTFDQTKGTRTIHFPLIRNAETPPEVTVVIRRTGADAFEAGVSFCATGDNFCKRSGRQLAFDRLQSQTRLRGNASDILLEVRNKLEDIEDRRDHQCLAQYSNALHSDVVELIEETALNKYFDQKDTNRGE